SEGRDSGARHDRPPGTAAMNALDFPSCPRCCLAPLRFVASGDCSDSMGGGVYSCTACSYSTARDALVSLLLREQRGLMSLFEDFAQLGLPRLTRCAIGQCAASIDPALDALRDLADLLGLDATAIASAVPNHRHDGG